jgi:hypothetical protein
VLARAVDGNRIGSGGRLSQSGMHEEMITMDRRGGKKLAHVPLKTARPRFC